VLGLLLHSVAVNRVVYDSSLSGNCPRCGKRLGKCTCGPMQAQAQQQRVREAIESAPAAGLPRDGVLRVLRDRKSRGGKVVTAIVGVPLAEAEKLGTDLKRLCGTGGTVKGDVVEIQGDHRDRLVEALRKRGYTVKLAGG